VKSLLYYIGVFLILISVSACSKELHEGDLVFHSSASSQSKAIQLATHSKYSHVGILFKKNGEWRVLEALETVQYTPFHLWVKQGVNSGYAVKRLKNADKALDAKTVEKMRATGESFIGKSYDYRFELSDERLYCSELVWKIYKMVLNVEIGNPAEVESFDFSSEEVKRKLDEYFGGKVPKNHDKVISPAEIFDSVLLKMVIEK
jgi:hypothetical protein